MSGVKLHMKALAVPVLVATMWALPSDRPGAEGAVAVEPSVRIEVAGAVQTTTSIGPGETARLRPSSSVFEPLADAAPLPIAIAPTTIVIEIAEFEVADQTPAPTLADRSLADEALDRVSFDWRSAFPEWQVEFRGPRDGLRALTYPAERRIEIFIRPTDTAATLHRVFAHELGHVVDVELNSDTDRARWLDERDIAQDTPWWPSAQAPDFATGAGDFAEAFAVWETGVSTRSTIGDQPGSRDVDLLRELSQN